MFFDYMFILFNSIIVRVKSAIIASASIATIIVAHSNLLKFGEKYNDLIVLICLVILSTNNQAVGQYKERVQ